MRARSLWFLRRGLRALEKQLPKDIRKAAARAAGSNGSKQHGGVSSTDTTASSTTLSVADEVKANGKGAAGGSQKNQKRKSGARSDDLQSTGPV